MDTSDGPDAPAPESPRAVRSDLFRINVSSIGALVAAAAAVVVAFVTSDEPPSEWTLPLPVMVYVVYWLSFTSFYLWWTHRTYTRASAAAIRSVAARDNRARGTLAGRLLSFNSPTDWTTAAAVVSVVITVVIALSPGAREDPVIILLGLATVVSAWATMVYSFAVDYMHVTLLQEGGTEGPETPHIRFSFDDEPGFSDYLTFSVMVSAMAVAAPAEITSRQMWRKVRSHVLLAFIFNTVIVAMMVSLLFGGLTSG